MNLYKENILKYGTFALFFLVPVMYFGHKIYPYMTSKTFFFYGFANILFFIWLYLIAVDKSYRLTPKQLFLFIPLFLYIIWMTIAGILAKNTHLSFWSSLGRGTGLLTFYYSVATALIITSLVKRNGPAYFFSLLKWFIFSATIVATTVWLGIEGFNIRSNFFINSGGGGLIGNSSLAAAYLIFAIFFGVFLLFSNLVSKTAKMFISGSIAIIIFSPLFLDLHGLIAGHGILGSARGAFLGIFIGVGAIIVGYFALSKNKVSRVLGIISIIISLTIFSIVWLQLMKPNTTLHNKFTEVASGSRFLFWDVAQKSIDKHPWFGYGPENYMIAFQENFNPKILNKELNYESWNDRAHNIYYDIGVSGGYPAIFLYFFFIFITLYSVIRLFKEEKIFQIQASILCGLIISFVFQNLFVFDSTLSILTLFSLAGLIYGMDGYNGKEQNIKDKKNEKLKGIIINLPLKILTGSFLFVLCIISLIYFAILPARKSSAFGIILGKPIETRPDYYKNLLKGSTVGNDWDISGFAHDLYKFYAVNPMSIKNNKKMLPFYEKDLIAFLQYIETIAKENTTDFRLQMKIFNLYSTYIFISDKPNDPVFTENLLDILNRAKALSPNNPEVYWGMAQLYAWSNNFKAIEQAYRQAIAIDPSVSASHRLLIQFFQAIGDKKSYNEAIIQAEENIPGFIEANKKELNLIQTNN